jgi:uncharacterized OB-fold protein
MEKHNKRFLNELFTKDAATGEYRLVGSKCEECGHVTFPKCEIPICPHCSKKTKMTLVPLSRVGTLYTYTIEYVGQPGFETPYANGYIDLPEGVRILSVIAETSEDALKIGAKMELFIDKICTQNGTEIIGYKFRLLKGDGE